MKFITLLLAAIKTKNSYPDPTFKRNNLIGETIWKLETFLEASVKVYVWYTWLILNCYCAVPFILVEVGKITAKIVLK